VTQRELLEGSLADMVRRIADQRQTEKDESVVQAPAASRMLAERRRRPRPPARLFPGAPR
jgi:hypothetical protein